MNNAMPPEDTLTFMEHNAERLANELFQCFKTTGFNALSKTDFYDYVLYLLDTYSNEHFLSARSNDANALLLKVSPAKIKTSKFNIHLKFTKPGSRNAPLLGFLQRVADGRVRLSGNKDEETYSVTVEDKVVQFQLDALMKEHLGNSPDYSFNREILKLSKADFYALLYHIVDILPEIKILKRQELINSLSQKETRDGLKTFFEALYKDFTAVQKAIPFFPAETVKKGLQVLFTTLNSPRSKP
jgi:hypothetical protein